MASKIIKTFLICCATPLKMMQKTLRIYVPNFCLPIIHLFAAPGSRGTQEL